MPNYPNRAVRPPQEDFDDDEEEEFLPRYQPTPTSRGQTYRVAGSVGPIAPRPETAIPRRPSVPMPDMALAPERPRRPAPSANLPVYSPRPGANARPAGRPVAAPAMAGFNLRWVGIVGAVVGVLVVSYLIVSLVLNGWQSWQDDQAYGRPRLTRLEAQVGHNESGPNSKTLFLGQNLHGQVSIIEIPGEDPAKTRVIVGPQLFGKDRELVPVKLSVQDVNGDGQPDLIATVQDQKLIYINENGSFRPINDQERAKLQLTLGN